MTAIILFTFAVLLVVLEARYEAEHGDTTHWDSLALSFGVYALLWCILKPCFVLLLPYVMARVWFDYVYNAFKGVSWDYLGSSHTDTWLKNLKPVEVFILRLLIFIVSWIIIVRYGC